MRCFLVLLTVLSVTPPIFALGPDEVLVLVNTNDPESMEVANYYREKRNIPEMHFVYLNCQGNTERITWDHFDKMINQPVLKHIKQHKLEGRIALWITTPSFPYRVGDNSISSAIFWGKEVEPVRKREFPNNPYFDRMGAFAPGGSDSGRYLHMMLTAGYLGATKRMIDRCVAADGSAPDGTVYFFDGAGPRAARRHSIPRAQRFLQLLGVGSQHKKGFEIEGANDVLGVYTGALRFPTVKNQYVAGALGDHLTSFGGILGDARGQMQCWEFLKAGCSATYGTVMEPYAYPQKFPTANLYFYYALGFSAVESYWMSVLWPQQGIFLGDPLTRPFGRPPIVDVKAPKNGQVVSKQTPVEIELSTPEDGLGGIGMVRLYVDGRPAKSIQLKTLPKDVTLTVGVGDKAVKHVTQGEPLTKELAGLQRRLQDEAKVDSQSKPAGLLLVRSPNSGTETALSAESSSPLLTLKPALGTFLAAEDRPMVVQWLLSGELTEGEQLELAIQEDGEVVSTTSLTVAKSGPVGTALEATVNQSKARLPDGYRVRFNASPASTQATVTLTALAARASRGPKARFRAVKADSKVKVTPADQFRSLIDPTLTAHELGWLHVGVGPTKFRMSTTIDTAQQLSNGRHSLRVIAYRGRAALESAEQTVTFIVRNSDSKMLLKPVKQTLKERDPETLVATAAVEKLPDAHAIFYINGIDVLELDGPPYELRVDPKNWGVGVHRIRAAASSGDSNIVSENELQLTIEP